MSRYRNVEQAVQDTPEVYEDAPISPYHNETAAENVRLLWAMFKAWLRGWWK